MTMNGLKLDLWTEVLLTIHNNPNTIISDIQRKMSCTYAHMLDIIKLLHEKELITTTKIGRTTEIAVTSKGKIVAKNIEAIKFLTGGIKNE